MHDTADIEVKKGILAIVEAEPGKEREVEAFLESALPLAEAETQTTAWFAIKLSDTKFGVFDAFLDDAGREAHLNGAIAKALMDGVGELYGPPSLEMVEIIGAKLP